jgi:hypothetical protein
MGKYTRLASTPEAFGVQDLSWTCRCFNSFRVRPTHMMVVSFRMVRRTHPTPLLELQGLVITPDKSKSY